MNVLNMLNVSKLSKVPKRATWWSAAHLCALALLAGCSVPQGTTRQPRGETKREPARVESSVGVERQNAVTSTPKLEGPLSVREAVGFAMVYHPELVAARARAEAAIGRKIQAGTFPNPVFSVGIEAAPMSGRTTGDAEYPIGITQTLPIGGRLGKAAEVEDAQHRRLLAELEKDSLQVERAVRGAFAMALFARDALVVEREMLRGAEEAAQIAAARVDAGDAAADEQARAELEALRARISLRRADVRHRRALIELRGALGDERLLVAELAGELEAALLLPELKAVLTLLEESPVLRAQVAAIAASEAELLREKASRIPDIDVGLFYRRLEETSDNGFDVAIGLPLPIFDRRQGAIRRARAEVREAEFEHRATGIHLVTRVKKLYWKLTEELETAKLFREQLAPRSESVLQAAEERYRAGATSLAELIPVRRDHRELRLAYLTLLSRIAMDWAEFRSLVGGATPQRQGGTLKP